MSSGFTLRETALACYNSARAISTTRIFGADADQMAQATANRLQFIDNAIATCEKAIGSDDRVLLKEPDDRKLEFMIDALRQHRELVEKPISSTRVQEVNG